jgi:UDP-2,4-diacetamido-2,4,6-trideoxy-beta-L-altropyranose hydrolase
MRCLALAQAWQDIGGDVVFAMAGIVPALRNRLLSEGMQVSEINASPGSAADIAKVIDLAGSNRANWTVVDGYQFDSGYQRGIKNAGLKLLSVDDNSHCDHYFADLVLNQNLHAQEDFYAHREGYTRLLLGSRYAMLRREFLRWKEWHRETVPTGRNVLVTMGGSDPENVTERVIQALDLVDLEDVETTVVLGASVPYKSSTRCPEDKKSPILHFEKDPLNMPELMARADVAVSAAGSTCWELCFLGLPFMLIDVAENQFPIAGELARREIAVHLGSSRDMTTIDMARQIRELFLATETRQMMSKRGRDLIDGGGAHRVVRAMLGERLRLRPATPEDCRMYWEWANDSEVRNASLSTEFIEWESHLAWFHAKLRDPNSLLWVVLRDDVTPLGQVRFQISGTEAVISLSVAKEHRGRAFSYAALEIACAELFRRHEIETIHAYVKPTNAASLRLFNAAGFHELPAAERIGDEPAIQLVFQKHR